MDSLFAVGDHSNISQFLIPCASDLNIQCAGHFNIIHQCPHTDVCLPFPQNVDTVVPVMNGHPRDQANVSVHCRWPPIRGTLTLKCVGWGIDNVAVQGIVVVVFATVVVVFVRRTIKNVRPY